MGIPLSFVYVQTHILSQYLKQCHRVGTQISVV